MEQHLYALGELVRLRSLGQSKAIAPGNYRIVGRLPLRDGEPCYRIRSDRESHDRIASQSDLREPREN